MTNYLLTSIAGVFFEIKDKPEFKDFLLIEPDSPEKIKKAKNMSNEAIKAVLQAMCG